MKAKKYSGENMAQDSSELEGVRILGAQSANNSDDSGEVILPASNTENVELPHWSEAPTGEVQIIGADQNLGAEDEIGEGWEALTGSQPRLRVDSAHWKDVDYDPELSLNDDSLNVGALGNDHISFNDNDDEFKKDVAEKRAMPSAAASDDMKATGQTPAVKKISTIPDNAERTHSDIEEISSAGDLVGAPVASERKSRGQRKSRSDYAGDASPKNKDNANQEVSSELSTLIQRTISALLLAGVAGICMYLGAVPTLIFVTLLIGFMSLELCNAFRAIGSRPAVILVGAMSMFSVVAAYLIGDRAVAVSVATFVAFAGAWYLLGVQKARPVVGMAISSLVFVYVGILGSFAGMILALKDSEGKSVGVSLLVGIVLCVAANDTTAYLAGKYFGRTPIAPKISPNKTMEGTTAGVVASLLISVFIASGLNSIFDSVPNAVLLGFVAAACAFVGDLVESMLKRDCNLKDFGTILPGHGGLMDRFDGLLFALPAIYFLAIAIN